VLCGREELAGAQGLRVVFQAEHVMSADQPVGHAVYPCTRADLGQLARELAVAGEAGGAHG
jgi:hypothetical protein